MNGETNHGEARQSEGGLALVNFALIPRPALAGLRGASFCIYLLQTLYFVVDGLCRPLTRIFPYPCFMDGIGQVDSLLYLLGR